MTITEAVAALIARAHQQHGRSIDAAAQALLTPLGVQGLRTRASLRIHCTPFVRELAVDLVVVWRGVRGPKGGQLRGSFVRPGFGTETAGSRHRVGGRSGKMCGMTPAELLALASDDIASRDAEALANAVVDLISGRPREGQLLDFKSGEGTRAAKRNALELRRDVSSFANAEGGVILFGVPEEAHPLGGRCAGKEVDGIHDDGARLEDWLESAMRPLLPDLLPFPRSRRVSIKGKDVVILAIRRTDRLVPCREKGDVFHYLRGGEGKFQSPHYLYSDRVLGRRERPSLQIFADDLKVSADGDQCLIGFRAMVASTGPVAPRALRDEVRARLRTAIENTRR